MTVCYSIFIGRMLFWLKFHMRSWTPVSNINAGFQATRKDFFIKSGIAVFDEGIAD